jgi:hypothetical protein
MVVERVLVHRGLQRCDDAEDGDDDQARRIF